MLMDSWNGQVEVDRGQMWSMHQKCGGLEGIVHTGSWSQCR